MRKSVAEVRKEGWIYRESSYIDWIVNPRYGAIYPHALVTFRWNPTQSLICRALFSLKKYLAPRTMFHVTWNGRPASMHVAPEVDAVTVCIVALEESTQGPRAL